MNIRYPYQFNTLGRTGETDNDRHIRDMIEQILFTAPGERVNRPDFGSGLAQLVFRSNHDELAITTQFMVQGALQQYLGDVIEVSTVTVVNEDAKLHVTVVYTVRRTQQSQVAQFIR